MTGRVLLLVDLSYQSYRASAAHPMLTDSSGRFTGGIYGFFQSVAKAVRETGATHLVACEDRKPYVRSAAYPEYKQLRKKTRDDDLLLRHNESMGYIARALDELSVPRWGADGFESDDMIGHAVLRHRNRFERVYAMSNDSDLFQLFWAPNFFVLAKGHEDLWDAEKLLRVHGLTPDQFMLSTALRGTHNDIAGIAGVGEKTGAKVVRDPGLLRVYRSKYGDLIDRNLGLIRLPHPDFPGAELPRGGEASPRDMYRALGRYDIETTAFMVEALAQIQPRRT